MANDERGSTVGDDVLTAVTDAMVALHERYRGREPTSARTRMLDPDGARVPDRRHVRGRREVERLTGRRVAQFMSTHHVGPDLELELLVLEP